MIYKHITGPKHGGLNTTYDKLPYYPIRLREKMSGVEVQPLSSHSKSEAISLMILRDPRRNAKNRDAQSFMSKP